MPFGQFPKFGVLSSVKVLMTGTNIAGPFAASIMAEMGAQVVQVESPNMPCQTRGNYGLLNAPSGFDFGVRPLKPIPSSRWGIG